MKKLISLLALANALTFTLVIAEGAHQHGVANATIVVSSSDLVIEIETPADNILGFEHEPKTKEQHAKLDDSLELLQKVDSVLSTSKSAKCSIKKTEVKSPFNEEHNEHEEHGEDEEHEEHGSHSDFDMHYEYTCKEVSELKTIEFSGLFEKFSNFTEVNVQWLYQNEQSAKTLTKQNTQINFK